MSYSTTKDQVLAVLFERNGARLDIRAYAGGAPRVTYTRPVGGGEVRYDAFPQEVVLYLLDSAPEVRQLLGAAHSDACVEYDEGDEFEGMVRPMAAVNLLQTDAEA